MTNDTILFFPHNMHHEDVFQKISGELLLNYGLKAKFLVSDESISKPGRTNIHRGALDFTCLSSDIAYELGRIKRTYPLFNISRAILTDRNVNFFPKFFNLNRLDFIDKQSELVALFLFFEDYLDNNSINFIISELIIGMPDAILYEVAKSKGVKYISMRSSRVFKGFIFSDPYTELPVGFDIKNAEESYKGSKNVYSNVLSYISSHKDLTTPHMLPHYMIRTSQTLKVFNVRYIKKFFLYILDKRINFFRSNFSENSIFRRVFYRLIKYKNTVVTYHLYKKYFYTDDIGKKKESIYYSLCSINRRQLVV